MSDAPVPLSTEETEASLPVTLKAGFMGVKSRPFALVITNHRLIFARLTGSELKRRTAELKQRAKDGGRGRIARTFAGSGAYSEFAQECAAMAAAAELMDRSIEIVRPEASNQQIECGHAA